MKKNYMAVAMLSMLALGAMSLESESAIGISLMPGPDYTHKVRFGIFSAILSPQIAVWVESEDGTYIDTIYVSGKSGTATWSAAGGSRRPEALPVWSHARGIAAPDGVYMPDRKHPVSDAVSGATPTKAETFTWKVPASLEGRRCRIRAELNTSFDWNESYPDKLRKSDPRYSEVNGQPSIVYEGVLELGGGAASVVLEPIGTGSLRGEDGNVTRSLTGLTTALRLVQSIEARYGP